MKFDDTNNTWVDEFVYLYKAVQNLVYLVASGIFIFVLLRIDEIPDNKMSVISSILAFNAGLALNQTQVKKKEPPQNYP